jgi:hypothetical protein
LLVFVPPLEVVGEEVHATTFLLLHSDNLMVFRPLAIHYYWPEGILNSFLDSRYHLAVILHLHLAL